MYQLYIEYNTLGNTKIREHYILDFDNFDKLLAYLKASEHKFAVCNIKSLNK